jgi:cytochrome c-type biogenesis protein CcmH/NrfF
MCPVCGTPLALSTDAPQAIQEREYIERLIDDCRSKDEIKSALAAQFGDAVLALPGDSEDDDLGDVLVYVVPAVGIALAAAGIAFAVVRWRRSGTGRGRPSGDLVDGKGRLEADMERYEL